MKSDFLKECMSDPALVKGMVPIDEFNRAYCVRCQQKECGRAAGNGSLFTYRAENWKTDLFENPPRAAENDPGFADIRAKNFLQVTRDTVEIRTNGETQIREMPHFRDTRDIIPEPMVTKPVIPEPTIEAPIPEAPDIEPELSPAVASAAESTPAIEIPIQPSQPVTQPNEFQNTPFEQGMVLPGGSEKVEEVGGTYVFNK